MKISNTNLRGVFISFVMLLLMASCGKSQNEGQGFSAGTPSVPSTNLGLEGSGNYSATSVTQLRELIRQGSFVRSVFRFGDFEEYSRIQGTCSTVYNDFLWIDDIPSTQCNATSSNTIREYTDGRITGHQFGNSKTQIINGLISLIDNSDSAYLVDDAGRIVYGGQQSSRLRVIRNENGVESIYYLDLRRPLVSNPASKYTENSTTGNTIEVIEYAYPQ